MKRWALVTVGLYLTLLGLLTAPVLLLGSLKYQPLERRWLLEGHLNVSELLQSGWYWVWLGVLGSAQLLLLLVPVDVAERRPTARRKLFVPVIVAGFLLANVLIAGVLAALVAVFRDDGLEAVATPAGWTEQLVAHLPVVANTLASLGITPGAELFVVVTLFWMLLLFWSLWALVFYHVAKTDEPDTLMRRVTRWLLRGSILELLVAVPSHVIVRHRDDCCAPIASFWGIVTGISVMFLSFGPGVLFLFAARIRDRKPKFPPPNS